MIGGITRASIRLRPASRPPRVRPASLARPRLGTTLPSLTPRLLCSSEPSDTKCLKDCLFSDGPKLALSGAQEGDSMKRFVLTLAWVLWAHEMAVGDRLGDRGYTAVCSFQTRQQCHAPLADYPGLQLVRHGKGQVELNCLPENYQPR